MYVCVFEASFFLISLETFDQNKVYLTQILDACNRIYTDYSKWFDYKLSHNYLSQMRLITS